MKNLEVSDRREKDNGSISREELREIIREVFEEEIKSDEFKATLAQIWRGIIVNYIGESIVQKVSFALWMLGLAFVYWIYDSGFMQWLKSKGLF